MASGDEPGAFVFQPHGAPPRPFARRTKVSEIGCGLIGCGTVGSGVVELWPQPGGAPDRARLVAVAVRHRHKRRSVDLSGVDLTDDALSVVRDPRVRVVIEATGDTELGYAVACESLARGKAFVTASKALVAAHGPELEELAAVQETAFGFEAAVGGAVPIVALLRRGLAPGAVAGLSGVLNGTCNFVLCALEAGVPFDQALQAARRAGLCEADSRRDTGGHDTADKLLILARLCGVEIARDSLPVTGIDGLRPADTAFARARGRALRLVGSLRLDGGRVAAEIEPVLVPAASPLAGARDEENVVVLDLGGAGPLALQARGAGSLPTASAVLSDVRAALAGAATPRAVARTPVRVAPAPAAPHYVRLDVPAPTALARRRLARALSSAGVGLTPCAEGAGVQAITSVAAGAVVRRALAGLPWPAVAVAIRDEWVDEGEGNERARTAGGRQA
jgi:homoserine dehydrogenase